MLVIETGRSRDHPGKVFTSLPRSPLHPRRASADRAGSLPRRW